MYYVYIYSYIHTDIPSGLSHFCFYRTFSAGTQEIWWYIFQYVIHLNLYFKLKFFLCAFVIFIHFENIYM